MTIFTVGFGRKQLTGPLPINTWNSTADTYRDPLYLTCVALSDGESTALIMSADVMKIDGGAFEECAKRLKEKLGIERKSILISAIHSHYAPTISRTCPWAESFFASAVEVAESAIADLAPAKVFAGKGHTDSLTFVRRYLLADGTWKFNPSAADNPVAHESEADSEMRTLRFVREGKKDILMANYQTHYHGGVGKNVITADVFGDFRALAEEALGCEFMYCSGASGNLNFFSVIHGERKHPSIGAAAAELLRTAKESIASETEVKTGKLVTATSVYKGKVRHDSEERIAQARQIRDAGRDTPEGAELVKKFGFVNKYEPGAILVRNNLGETLDLHFFTVAFGDVAVSGVPFEQFDTNAQEVRAASPFKMTFTLSMTNESFAYVPSALADHHRSYEVATSKFVPGSGTEFAAEQLRLLGECKSAY
ncbi:MAG: hypothetical protein E7580_01400 [Ruminococcaceae bacterium]|nr:hypothetical protein [Oscillospiraceae bacterium]